MTSQADIDAMTETPPTSSAECHERIQIKRAEASEIATQMHAARLRYDCGEDIDWGWFNRANAARKHIKRDIAALQRLQADLAKSEKQAAIAAQAERERQAMAAKAARKAASVAHSDAEQRAKLKAVLDHLRAKHPGIMPEVWAVMSAVEQQMRAA